MSWWPWGPARCGRSARSSWRRGGTDMCWGAGMLATHPNLNIERNAPLPTGVGIGGNADRLARPASLEQLKRCIEADPTLRVLGDGANLLVDDRGVAELVVQLNHPELSKVEWGERGRVIAMGGANLPKLITEAVRRGLGGLEGLGGIPASVGGAAMMNAGAAFAE